MSKCQKDLETKFYLKGRNFGGFGGFVDDATV